MYVSIYQTYVIKDLTAHRDEAPPLYDQLTKLYEIVVNNLIKICYCMLQYCIIS